MRFGQAFFKALLFAVGPLSLPGEQTKTILKFELKSERWVYCKMVALTSWGNGQDDTGIDLFPVSLEYLVLSCVPLTFIVQMPACSHGPGMKDELLEIKNTWLSHMLRLHCTCAKHRMFTKLCAPSTNISFHCICLYRIIMLVYPLVSSNMAWRKFRGNSPRLIR